MCLLILQSEISNGGYNTTEQNNSITQSFLESVGSVQDYLQQLAFSGQTIVSHFDLESFDEKDEETSPNKGTPKDLVSPNKGVSKEKVNLKDPSNERKAANSNNGDEDTGKD